MRELKIFNCVYDDISYIKKIAAALSDNADILVFGIGGSSLGSKALIDFKSGFSGEKSKIQFLENIDSRSFMNVVSKCNPDSTGVVVISKSGTTSETLMLFMTLMTMWPDFDCSRKCVAVTENSEQNYLRKIAILRDIKIMDHPTDIGGRFSVFSVVGLLPAIIHGVDVDGFIRGAKRMLLQAEENPAALYSDLRDVCTAIRGGATHHVLFTYSDFLGGLGKWFMQLIAESLGKNENFGINPMSSIGTIDQHSMLQLFLGGPNDKFYTFITQKENVQTCKIRLQGSALENHNIQELMTAHQRATIEALRSRALVRSFEFEEINEEAIGYIMMRFFIETVAIADEFNVNPFDQPAVEEVKRLAFKHLDAIAKNAA
jgi:glucose-6-phosphate isomerase